MPFVAHLYCRWHVTDKSNLIEIPGWMPENERGICGTLLLRMPPEQGRAVLDRMKMKPDDEPEIVEPE